MTGTGFWQGLADSFRKNFIEEARWKMILSGLGVTFVIAVCSALFGTVLGFGLCLLRRSRNRVALRGDRRLYPPDPGRSRAGAADGAVLCCVRRRQAGWDCRVYYRLFHQFCRLCFRNDPHRH